MEPHDLDRDDDATLREALRAWRAPGAPPSLRARVIGERRPWWHWPLTGSIRIPAPAVIVALAVLAVWMLARGSDAVPPASGAGPAVSLADFAPLPELAPRIIGEQ